MNRNKVTTESENKIKKGEWKLSKEKKKKEIKLNTLILIAWPPFATRTHLFLLKGHG